MWAATLLLVLCNAVPPDAVMALHGGSVAARKGKPRPPAQPRTPPQPQPGPATPPPAEPAAAAAPEQPAADPTPQPAPPPAPAAAGPATPAPAAAEVLAVLPIRVLNGGAEEAAALLSTALAAELEQLTHGRVISASEVDALLQNEAERQGVGARDDGALAEIVGAMGARQVVAGELERTRGVHVWHASLVSTQDGSVLERVDTKANTVEALTAQVRDVAYTLLGRGDEVKLEGRAARKRMGLTRNEDLQAFAQFREKQPDVTTTEAFTRFILDHNQESNVLAVTQAVLLMGAALMGSLAVAGAMSSLIAYTTFRSPPLVLAVGAATWLLMLPALGMGITGLVLAIVDAFNTGSVKVTSDGCCRDDAQLFDEAQKTRLRRVAALGISLAGPAAVIIGLMGAQTWFLASTFLPAAGIGYKSTDPYDQALVLNPLFALAGQCMGCTLFCSYGCCVLPLCVGSPTGLFLLFWPDRPLVEEVPVKPAPKNAAPQADEAEDA